VVRPIWIGASERLGERENLMKSHEQKRTEGIERNASWGKLSPQDQLADLDRRLGEGVGAQRQRAKLVERIRVGGKA
jgi:hypothetical protein